MDAAMFTVFAAFCAAAIDALGASGPAWNDLKLNHALLNSMPRTRADALAAGWTQIQAFSSSGQCGERYVKPGEFAVVLIFDRNGYIAGIASGVPDNLPSFPHAETKHFFVRDAKLGFYFANAYFVDPQVVCGPGRTAAQYKQQGTGTLLAWQRGPTTYDAEIVSSSEGAMSGADFTRGQCFWTMGVHFFKSTAGAIKEDVRCGTLYPFFAMYNEGRLDGFGFAMTTKLSATYWEQGVASALFNFWPTPVPKCLLASNNFATIHIYFTSNPRQNFC